MLRWRSDVIPCELAPGSPLAQRRNVQRRILEGSVDMDKPPGFVRPQEEILQK